MSALKGDGALNVTDRSGSVRISRPGQVVFALTLIGIGIHGLALHDFSQIWLPVPPKIPAHVPLSYLCSLISIGTGVGLFWRPVAARAARILLGFLLAWFLLLRLPLFVADPVVDMWYSSCQMAIVVASAWSLDAWFTSRSGLHSSASTARSSLRISRGLFGAALIPIGLAHFLYLEATAPLVPRWLPGPTTWAYFTGGAFMAAGISLLVGVWSRLAATLAVLQICSFILLVWVPRVFAGTATSFQVGEIVVSWVLAASGWVIVESYRGERWLGVGHPQ